MTITVFFGQGESKGKEGLAFRSKMRHRQCPEAFLLRPPCRHHREPTAKQLPPPRNWRL
jgi:hypothetical protein